MSRGATARLFIAVDPPDSVRDELAGWARAALRGSGARKGGGACPRVLDPDLLHVTLCFLGDRPVSEIDLLSYQLAACGGPVGELSLGAPVWLPTRHPRALAVELHDQEGGLARLHAATLAAVAEVSGEQHDTGGDSGHRRSFRAHVTVARMGRGAAPRERVLPPTPSLSFVPRELMLYRSWLSPEGAGYEALASHPIG